MHAANLRYFAFVSKFVDAVTTSALDETLSRAVATRRLQNEARRSAAMATGVVPTARAA